MSATKRIKLRSADDSEIKMLLYYIVEMYKATVIGAIRLECLKLFVEGFRFVPRKDYRIKEKRKFRLKLEKLQCDLDEYAKTKQILDDVDQLYSDIVNWTDMCSIIFFFMFFLIAINLVFPLNAAFWLVLNVQILIIIGIVAAIEQKITNYERVSKSHVKIFF